MRGGIFAEFGKIVCISVGFITQSATGKQIRMKSFYHEDEETLLKQFKSLLDEHYNSPYSILCGHNAKEFDFPYICRRIDPGFHQRGFHLPTMRTRRTSN